MYVQKTKNIVQLNDCNYLLHQLRAKIGKCQNSDISIRATIYLCFILSIKLTL